MRAGLVDSALAWEWSSLHSVLKPSLRDGFIKSDRVLALFHDRPVHAVALLRQLIALPSPSDEELIRNPPQTLERSLRLSLRAQSSSGASGSRPDDRDRRSINRRVAGSHSPGSRTDSQRISDAGRLTNLVPGTRIVHLLSAAYAEATAAAQTAIQSG